VHDTADADFPRLGQSFEAGVEVGAEVGPYAAAMALLREQVGANPNPSG